MPRPIICIDFDGVIHSYEKGWQDGVIYGRVLEGFFEWAELAKENFQLVVYSTRSSDQTKKLEMASWLREQYVNWLWQTSGKRPLLFPFLFSSEKPKAFLTIDDRALRFDGDWSAQHWHPTALRKFKPWNQS